jgi:hypothetical protein
MKVMYDIDPKSLKKLESIANARRLSIGEVSADLIMKLLNRDPASGPAASSSDTHRPSEPAPVDDTMLIMLLEPFIARFRLLDPDGSQRRAVLAEFQMLPSDGTVAKVTALLKRSLE